LIIGFSAARITLAPYRSQSSNSKQAFDQAHVQSRARVQICPLKDSRFCLLDKCVPDDALLQVIENRTLGLAAGMHPLLSG
jgi:hypothetical protein